MEIAENLIVCATGRQPWVHIVKLEGGETGAVVGEWRGSQTTRLSPPFFDKVASSVRSRARMAGVL